ncbi:hypothetical protein [Solimonas terrae]|uniref:Uncharacterized protein n=1 Tax=Solimonas terrae TaxID=1396819 RepID=A0A6M2BN95_9GAMM|nr:hypothetical protein [Solimonas terrae]NGY03780.1 hypothetical protein [Solimonas terrae]
MNSPAMLASLLLATTLVAPALADNLKAAAPGPAPAAIPHDCIRETGTLIPNKDGKCLAVPGQVLTSEDLQHTGATNTADAIRALVPSAR